MKTVCENTCEIATYDPIITATTITSSSTTMTRKRMSDEVCYAIAEEQQEQDEDNSSSDRNKLPRFEYVTQISAGPSNHHHHQLLGYCTTETVDFHNEKGQRIFLTDYSENAEFVNIMLQDNLLSVQAPMLNGHHHTAELIELNSAELLDLDGKGRDEEVEVATTTTMVVDQEGEEDQSLSSRGVTFVNHNNDFEKQLVRVEIQDEHHPHHPQQQQHRGQTVNICTHQPTQLHRRGSLNLQGNEDLEDKNLSWLFNFKLDELPHLSPEVSHRSSSGTNSRPNVIPGRSSSSPQSTSSSSLAGGGGSHKNQDRRSSIQESSVTDNNCPSSIPEKVQKKPPFTYTELIEYALEDQSELTVSGIYQWISDRFPYYKSNDDRWKNSVRHNLSINPHFRKGSKAPQGAGHLWTIASRDSEANNLAWEHKKQRLELFFKMEAAANMAFESERQSSRQTTAEQDELLAATASIMLPEDATEVQNQQHQQQGISNYGHESLITSHYFSQTEPDSQQIIYDTVNSSDDLCRVATEILNGVRRNVEVQIIHPNGFGVDTTTTTVIDSCYTTADYLNPIPKDEIMQESGLRSQQCLGQDFFVTEELDPVELGINMTTSGEDEVFFSDDFNHYFGHNIVA